MMYDVKWRPNNLSFFFHYKKQEYRSIAGLKVLGVAAQVVLAKLLSVCKVGVPCDLQIGAKVIFAFLIKP